MTERICIFIDGGNFYHLVLKKLGIDELHFDFDKFVDFIANRRTVNPMCKRFYVGTVREKEGDLRSKVAMTKQRKLFSKLILTKWDIKTSKLKMRTEEIFIDQRVQNYENIRKAGITSIFIERQREKGIDVKLATDLIVGAVDNKYDTAVVISSDTDLIPAIDWVRHRKNKKIEYIGFSIPDPKNPLNNTKPLTSMIPHTDIQRIFSHLDLKPFIKPIYKGTIIEESLENTAVLKQIKIKGTKVEKVNEKHKTPWLKQWTLHTVEIFENDIDKVAEEISKAIDTKHSGNWYADFKNDHTHYIVFTNKVFKVDRNKPEEYEAVTKYGISLRIPDYQLDFSPDIT